MWSTALFPDGGCSRVVALRCLSWDLWSSTSYQWYWLWDQVHPHLVWWHQAECFSWYYRMKGWPAGDMGSLEKWAHINLMRFNKVLSIICSVIINRICCASCYGKKYEKNIGLCFPETSILYANHQLFSVLWLMLRCISGILERTKQSHHRSVLLLWVKMFCHLFFIRWHMWRCFFSLPCCLFVLTKLQLGKSFQQYFRFSVFYLSFELLSPQYI